MVPMSITNIFTIIFKYTGKFRKILADKDTLKYSFLIGIFVMPFVFWPGAQIAYEIPRVWFVQRWIEILLLLSLFNSDKIKKQKINLGLIIFVLAFLGIVYISSIAGVDFGKSFWGNVYRGDGIITLSHLVALLFFIVLFWQKSWFKETLFATFLGSFFVGLLSIHQGIQYYLLGNQTVMHLNNAIGATFGQPNFLAGYLLVTLPSDFYFLKEAQKKPVKIFFLFGLILKITAILMTKSRFAILISLFLPIFFLLISKVKVNYFLIFVVFLLISVLYYSYFLYTGLSVDKTTLTQNDYRFEGRQRIYIKGAKAFLSKPYIGWGWANFDYAFESIVWPGKFFHDAYVDKAHSIFLEVITATGIFGFFVFLTIVFKSGKMLYCSKERHSKILFLILFLYLIQAQTNVISIAEELYFWIVLGISTRLT